MVPRASIGLLLATLSLAPAASAESADLAPVRHHSPNRFIFGLGPSYWPGVHDIDPSGSPYAEQLGLFHTWGLGIELGYQRRVTRLGRVDLLVGGELGLFGHENSEDLEITILPPGETFDGTLMARALYLTWSVKFEFAADERWRLSAGAGAGYYEVDFAELFDDGFEAAELFSEGTFGGYASVGADRRMGGERSRWWLRLEQKFHFVDFGSADSYAPGGGDLTGPISALLVGFVYDR